MHELQTNELQEFNTWFIFKSALKYSRSNLVNQQGDLQWKIAKKKKKPIKPTFRWVFSWLGFLGFLGWVFSCQPWSSQVLYFILSGTLFHPRRYFIPSSQVLYSTLAGNSRACIVQYSTVQYSTVQYSTVQFGCLG